MATDKKKTVPAGINDKFSINVVNTKTYFKEHGMEPFNVVSNSAKREILSTDLIEGMTIPAVVTKNRNSIKEKAKNDR